MGFDQGARLAQEAGREATQAGATLVELRDLNRAPFYGPTEVFRRLLSTAERLESVTRAAENDDPKAIRTVNECTIAQLALLMLVAKTRHELSALADEAEERIALLRVAPKDPSGKTAREYGRHRGAETGEAEPSPKDLRWLANESDGRIQGPQDMAEFSKGMAEGAAQYHAADLARVLEELGALDPSQKKRMVDDVTKSHEKIGPWLDRIQQALPPLRGMRPTGQRAEVESTIRDLRKLLR